ncbi:hypothetical protein CVCC1112_1326 [Paenarthrobacter nicotinovorans]|nr:hypothetical protein CVCC1112_1326 [Paenarthrobacter nicotinovorans]
MAVAVTPSRLLLLMVLVVVAVFWMMGTGTQRSSSEPG